MLVDLRSTLNETTFEDDSAVKSREALCVNFTILVSFLPQRLKSTFFEIFLEWSGPEGTRGVKKCVQKTLILVFEVNMQPPKAHFLTFSSETKIMKITHSEEGE